MPRKKAFDPEHALEQALLLFWEKGYEATSMQDLVDHMGINRFSLYTTFGDKHQLFLTVLDRYRDMMVTQRFGMVEQPDASLREIQQYFDGLVSVLSAFGLPGRGCLMANTMSEPVRSDPAIADRLHAHFERLFQGFHRALSNAQSKQEVRYNLELDVQARFLAVSAQGLHLYARICQEKQALQEFANTVLATLIGRF